MKRASFHVIAPVTLIVAGLASLSALLTGRSTPSTKNGEWPAYTADVRGSKYSPLDQINAGNFNKLEVAWRFKTDNLGTRDSVITWPGSTGDSASAGSRGSRADAAVSERDG